MKIKKEDVLHVAHLARIWLSDEELDSFAGQLNDILTYMERLSEVSTDKVEPTFHPLPIKNIFRQDEVKPSLTAEESLSIAPVKLEGCFKVPKIIEE